MNKKPTHSEMLQADPWSAAHPDVYVPSENEAEAALADAALMNENMRLYGCIDKPKDVGVPYTCIDELQQF